MTNGIGDGWRALTPDQLEHEYSPSAWSKRPWDVYKRDFALESARDSAAIGVACVRQTTHRMLLARIDRPRANLVWIHGGYWQDLNANDSMHHAQACMQAGINYTSVDYTLAPEATIDQMVDECVESVQALAELAPAPIIVAGHSAGAHLAAMVAAKRPSLVHSLLLFSGIYDLRPIVHTSVNDVLHLDEDAAWRLSPLRLPFPPTIGAYVLYGEDESAQFIEQSQAMARRLWTEAQRVPGADHFDVVLDADFPALVDGLLASHERVMERRVQA